MKDPKLYAVDSGFSDILGSVWCEVPHDTSAANFPSTIAKKIEEFLNKQFKKKQLIFATSFVGMAIDNYRIYISWAGLFRTHLIKDGHIVYVTRDHNPLDDPWPDMQFPSDPTRRGLDLYTPTRQLVAIDPIGDSSWESVEWKGGKQFEILVCSENYHMFKQPEEYAFVFSNILDEGLEPEPVVGGGLIVKIGVRPEVS